jgi:hypothetical protein
MNRSVLAVGAPRDLAKNYWGQTTKIELKELKDGFVRAVKTLPFATNVRTEGSTILVDLDDPLAENPRIVDALIKEGAKIEYVSELRRTLEDVYLKLIGGKTT